MNNQLYIYDCLTGKLRASNGDFMTVGAGVKNTFRIDMEAENAGSFAQRAGVCRFFLHGNLEGSSLNGSPLENVAAIKPEHYYFFVIGAGCFIAWYGAEERRPDFSQLDPGIWYIYNPTRKAWTDGLPLEELPSLPDEMKDGALATFQGLGKRAFLLSDILKVAERQLRQKKDPAYQPPPPSAAPASPSATDYRCPSCWELFSKEKALAIATHPALCGDDKLGEDAMRRFRPSRYDGQGLPYDACGSLCHEFACPYCHQKLPPFFGQMEQFIFSIVGAPAAGKTYYLASLIHDLELELPREFKIPFRDADPTGNAPLNDMRMRVFTAQTPQEAYIGKTRLQGRLYRKVWRRGHVSSMPRPFIYHLNHGDNAYSLVLYDNAGENFEPERDYAQTMGADHLKVANAILFLFDPTTNPGFRSLLKDSTPDPQFQQTLHPPGRQSLLLAETEIRLRTSLNLPPGKKVDTPLAIIIGKCDTWEQLLGPEPLLPLISNGQLRPEHIAANSARLRELLFRISPHICLNAEAISDRVCYFAASSLGASPVEFRDEETGQILIGPASGKIKPFHVTDPVIWALSCLAPSLFPGSRMT